MTQLAEHFLSSSTGTLILGIPIHFGNIEDLGSSTARTNRRCNIRIDSGVRSIRFTSPMEDKGMTDHKDDDSNFYHSSEKIQLAS